MNRSRTRIFPGSCVCAENMIVGDITIGNNCVIHPYVQILAATGPIIIGDNCVIEERVQIIHRAPPNPNEKKAAPIVIGSNNTFEVGCRVEATKIGNNNVFESRCFVGNKVTISNGCTIGAGCTLKEEIDIRDNMVVYGRNSEIREALREPSSHPDMIETYKNILYRNHRVMKTTHRHQSSKCEN